LFFVHYELSLSLSILSSAKESNTSLTVLVSKLPLSILESIWLSPQGSQNSYHVVPRIRWLVGLTIVQNVHLFGIRGTPLFELFSRKFEGCKVAYYIYSLSFT